MPNLSYIKYPRLDSPENGFRNKDLSLSGFIAARDGRALRKKRKMEKEKEDEMRRDTAGRL